VPVKEFYVVGDVIACYADGHPPPFYRWQNMRTLNFTTSQNYTVNADDLGHNTTMRCQAQNLIQGFIYSDNIFVQMWAPLPTTPTTVPTTPPTTTPPFDAPCDNLTGWWISESPYAELNIIVASGVSGIVTGFLRNHTDQQWVEVIGRTRTTDYAYVGLSAIWPFDIGVTGMSGECHKCSGVEQIQTSGMWRSRTDSLACGHGGNPQPGIAYRFHRL